MNMIYCVCRPKRKGTAEENETGENQDMNSAEEKAKNKDGKLILYGECKNMILKEHVCNTY